jgi:uncharacterized membrane protein (UPF0136 family)
MKRRPPGLVLVVLWLAIDGVLSLIAGIIGLVASDPISSKIVMLAALLLSIGIVLLVAAYGLWTLQRWGLRLTKVILVISIVVGVLDVALGGKMAYLIQTALEVVAFMYLIRPETNALFWYDLKEGIMRK